MPHSMPALVNPLAYIGIDLVPPLRDSSPSAEDLLAYLVYPEEARSLDAIVMRCREIAKVAGPLPFAPYERTILDKLVWPLRHAKGSFVLANYIGCIALCGMVGEMVATLLWDISKPSLLGRTPTEAEERAFFGRTFERLEQGRKIEVLKALGLVGDEAEKWFDDLRDTRNRYLHRLSQGHESLADDAKLAFGASVRLVSFLLGLTFQEGTVVLRPELARYLEEQGLMQPVDPR